MMLNPEWHQKEGQNWLFQAFHHLFVIIKVNTLENASPEFLRIYTYNPREKPYIDINTQKPLVVKVIVMPPLVYGGFKSSRSMIACTPQHILLRSLKYFAFSPSLSLFPLFVSLARGLPILLSTKELTFCFNAFL